MREIDAGCLSDIRQAVFVHYNWLIDMASKPVPYYDELMRFAGAADYATGYLSDPADLDDPDSVISQINKVVGDAFDELDHNLFVAAIAKAVETVAAAHFGADLDLTADDFVERATTDLDCVLDPKAIAADVITY